MMYRSASVLRKALPPLLRSRLPILPSSSNLLLNKRTATCHDRFYTIRTATTASSSSVNAATTSTPIELNELQQNLRPSEIVEALNNYVVGQQDAKRAVAIALRNRWRRRLLPEEMRKEIVPRNVLLVGPTGCGKTEVARRMAMLNDAPFIKVEATKFTEVGYHGRDVDKIIMDLMDISMTHTRKRQTDKVKAQAEATVEERILDLLMGPTRTSAASSSTTGTSNPKIAEDEKEEKEKRKIKQDRSERERESFRTMLRDGMLDEQEVEVDVPLKSDGNEGGSISFGGDGSNTSYVSMKISVDDQTGGSKRPTKRQKLPIAEARNVLMEEEIEKLLATIDLKKEAITAVEETGIVFIDEIDKICTSSTSFGRSTDASAEGVQRDLLPLVEGTTVSTKHGNVNTDYILFVASGAFHSVKPSDLLPELQGRLPVRVNLQGLTEDDLYKILTEPVANMIRQQVELLRTEGVELKFDDDAIREIAKKAALFNKSVENIGARRLHTVMEKIMEDISFDAAEHDMRGKTVTVDKGLVERRLEDVTTENDLKKFIL